MLVIRVSYLLGADAVEYLNVSVTHRGAALVDASCRGDSCTVSGPVARGMRHSIVSPSTTVYALNMTLPWSISGPVEVVVNASDTLHAGRRLLASLTVASSTAIDRYELSKTRLRRGERLRVALHVAYSGTSIPAAGERVAWRIRGPVAPTSNTNAVYTDENGTAALVLNAPGEPGTYQLVLEPEHGSPVMVAIEVMDACGGAPVSLGEAQPISVAAASVLAALLLGLLYHVARRRVSR